MSYGIVFTGEIRSSVERRYAIAALGREFGLGFSQIKGLLTGTKSQIKITDDRVEACQLMQKFWEAGWHTQLNLDDHLIHCTAKSSNCGGSPLPPALEFMGNAAGTISIGIPVGWQKFDNLNGEAVIQAGNPELNRYLIVLKQDRSQLPQELSVDHFGKAQIEQCLTRVDNGALISGPEPLISNTQNGHIYEMSAEVTKTPVRYLVTFFECQDSFYSVFLWSSLENFENSRSEFLHIFATFKVMTSPSSCESTLVPM
ncbi:hypothetical protein ACJJIW_04790 [Microbulbifer sp. JMSA004]|uniref:hypothetical protein n=1 Tax=unclassified Microbulbifer TaxID=2619833 RepID=UPI0024AE32A4|nr:hypothetical protein [Microbulbifer sp. VAAF005]WHI44529.1 hypothetical protein P0078_12245 [Microbulbifer sp. VAAF005]